MLFGFAPCLSLVGTDLGVTGSSLKTVIAHTVISDPLYRVSCVGDSITKCDDDYEGRTDGYPRAGSSFPNRLPALLGSDYDVKDCGVNGACALVVPPPSQSIPSPSYSMQPEYALAQQFNPHYVIIMLGTNDSNQLNWVNNAFFESDLGEIITTFLNIVPQPPLSSPKVILCSPIPGLFPNAGLQPDIVENEIVPRVQSLLQSYPSVVGLDCFTPFLDQPIYYEKGVDAPLGDGIHPNNAGDDLLAGLIHAAMFAPLDKTPPSTPPAPQATVLSPTSIRLAWNPSTGSPTGYHVLRDDVVIGIVKTGIYNDPNLPSKGSYRYRVRAFDGSMNLSGMSEETLVNTNQLPVLSLIGNKTVRVGETIQFTVSASDSDDPEPTLEYSAVAP
ncbi:MAG: GDSL-type esterase/lipase family protein [Opitutales bacterium]|nr:GDSL-type esterase/lipase family protein [Opitutales bacterium]